MFRLFICTAIFNFIFAQAKFYPTDVGIGSGDHLGIGLYGGKYTNVEYGPGQGQSYSLGHSAYTPNVAYTHGIGVPQHVGLGGGLGLGHSGVELGYGQGGFNYKGAGPLGGGLESVHSGVGSGYGRGGFGYRGVDGTKIGSGYSVGHSGYGSGIGAVGLKAGGIGYGSPVEGLGYGGGVAGVGYEHYPAAVGIQKDIGYGYGQGIGYNQGAYNSPVSYGLGVGKVIGGSEIDKNIYIGENKNIVGEHFVKSHGQNGQALNHGDVGYTSGQVALKDVKGESVHFSDADGVNNAHHAGKAYKGGEHFDKEGKQGSEQVLNENHKKGHNVKSFKTSHHLDESGKTEQFYDEDHDEGGNYAFGGHAGKFGETGGSSFHGGFNDGKYNAGEAKKEGHFGNEYLVDKAHAGQGKFGGNNFARNEESYGLNKGIGEQGLSGHHELNSFYKKYPSLY
ncbi:hypothetical protein JTB14_024315 [Gonioctena quinquepunctata]|nr:hypothetical protein JTB14_024315 [Gonioctena quinquepunctata]